MAETTAPSVIVTGAGAGIGRAIAARFLDSGARVHIADVDAAALEATLAAEPRLRGTLADVGRPDDVDRLFAEARAWLGPVDVLVNNVGIAGPRAPVEEIDLADWDATLRINLGGMFLCIRQALPEMKARQRGAIVNISTASVRTLPLNRSIYNVSKAAVEALTLSVAREAGPFGVRCNAIRPGAMDGERLRRVLGAIAREKELPLEAVETDLLRFVSMRSKIQPEEIGDTAVFLAGDAARHVTGQIVSVCGNIEWEE